MWDDDEYDAILLRAIEESKRTYEEEEVLRLSQIQSVPSTSSSRSDNEQPGPSNFDSFKRPALPSTSHANSSASAEELYDGSEAEGFNFEAGRYWVYPTNDKFPVRTYQKDIVEKALFNNTLVSLPTGLGKTFIAAVVMYNYYMWYPKGKIIFMAPTKPLVAQQIENCIDILGIPESHTAEMTGAIHSKLRAVTWKEKRIFFLTPQVVQNDLSANICPAKDVKCVVIDEAHRALGDHAYAQVIRLLNSYEARFRVLALSATPGSDLEAVQKVITNLMINHIELRSEESLDLVQYTHQRNVELMVVDMGPTIIEIRQRYINIAGEYAASLLHRRLLFGNVGNISRFAVLREWENFRREGSQGMDQATVSRINCDFGIVLTLVHGLELLQTYGLRLLLNHLKGALNNSGNGTNANAMNRLKVNENLKTLMADIEKILNPNEDNEEDNGTSKKKFIYGHPKLDRLQDIIVSHFENFEKKGSPTRAIVFCEYREGVIEICDMLKNFEPLVKPVLFMGQSTGKTSKGISQKQQLEIMEKFRKGIYNTLISTSVGEEGLDIGEVDLIICFDAKNSPIRQVQRMGRTGRKREGRIIMLVTRGKEEQKYKQGLFKKKNVKDVLLSRENLASHFFEDCPSMLPPGVQPKYTERKITPAASKPKSNQLDLRKMFARRSSKNSSGAATANSRPVGKVSCLSEEDFKDVKDMNYAFDRIPNRTEFWSKGVDESSDPDISLNNIDFGANVEFMRYQQRTHLISNSSDSLMLSQLLQWADDRRDDDYSVLGGAFTSQVTSSQIWPAKQRKRGRPSSSDAKTGNPPKKRCRSKKDAVPTVDIATMLKKQDASVAGQSLNQSVKRKSKPQFIEDEEELSPVRPASQRINAPDFLSSPSKHVVLNQSSIIAAQEENIVTLDSDDEADMNSTTSSGFAYLSSQPTKQHLYSELSMALKKKPFDDGDECDLCDTLFSCKSVNKLVLQRNTGDVCATWGDVKKSLENVKAIVSEITKEMLYKHPADCQKSEYGSQVVLSLKLGGEGDYNVDGGVLCGGVGDLSQPRTDSFSQENFGPLQKDSLNTSIAVRNNLDHKIEDHVADEGVKDSTTSVCSNPKKELDLNKNFDDDEFDFLGLSKIDDIFGSPILQDEDDFIALDKAIAVKEQSPVRPLKQPCEPKEKEALLNDFTQTKKVERASFKLQEKPSSDDLTPTKKRTETKPQLSPILCSQVPKKPRLALRRKISVSTRDMINEAPKSSALNDHCDELPKSLSKMIPVGDEAVISSSHLKASQHNDSSPEINFDIFDESLLCDEENDNASKVDNDLKDLIRNKALKAKAVQREISYTQELREMCDSSMGGGLTQMFDMLDKEVKEKSPKLKIERADSSSSPKPKLPTCPDILLDDKWSKEKHEDVAQHGSDEDLFADCDDSNSCQPDSSVREPESLPLAMEDQTGHTSVLGKSPNSPTVVTASNFTSNHFIYNGVDGNVGSKTVADELEVIESSQRCVSPIFKPSQAVKRPSKLSLKKRKTESNDNTAFNAVTMVKKDDSRMPDKIKSEEENITATQKFSIAKKEDCGIQEKNKNEQKEITVIKNSKQTDECFQTDFSMFGDEFNNSWLYSQDCDKNFEEISKVTDEGKTTCVKEFSTNENGKFVQNVSNETNNQNPRLARENSPENDLDLAFARLDELRSQKKRISLASSSTPKPQRIASVKSLISLSPRRNTRKAITLSSSDDDEEPMQRNRKGKKSSLNITSSSEEGIKHSIRPSVLERKRKHSDLQSASNDTGDGWISTRSKPNNVIRKTNGSHVKSIESSLLDLSSFCDDALLDDLDDGVENNEGNRKDSKEKSNMSSSDDDAFVQRKRKKAKLKFQKRPKKHKKGNNFILSEAVESDDAECDSSDGETTSLDELDSSFINDSQPEASQSVVDIHAKYLQSVRSPSVGGGRFKIPARLPQLNMDVYSQYPDASELNQSYANDSFCVDTEATQYENPEMSLLEIAEAKLKASKKEKRKLKKQSNNNICSIKNTNRGLIDSDDSVEEIPVRKKRSKRIIIVEDSPSEDEEVKIVSHVQVGSKNHKVEENTPAPVTNETGVHRSISDDFAKLLDDGIDFSIIPDDPGFMNDKTEKHKSFKPQNLPKFSKKVPLLSTGASIEGNTLSAWQCVPRSTTSYESASCSKETSTSSAKFVSAPASHQKVLKTGSSLQIFIIASSRQIASSTDLLRVLRTSHNVCIIPRSIPEADFIMSWRLGVLRIFTSDLKDRRKLEEHVKKLKASFSKPYLIVEKDRIKSLASAGYQKKKSTLKAPVSNLESDKTSSCQSFWMSANVCNVIALLRQAGLHLLFSQDKDETAGFLAKLAKKEMDAGHGIPEKALQNESDEVESRLQFFTSLPGINLAFALKLLRKFHTISDFCARCSSVLDITNTLGVDINAARRIHNILCEVHVSP